MSSTRPPTPTGHHTVPDPVANRNAFTSHEDADPTSYLDSDMGVLHREKDIRPRIEIVLDKERFYLKGTGGNVEPARISGHVALYLKESTSVKELTLQFRGKARIPTASTDSNSNNHSHSTYLLCSHEWSFLEGPKRHSHTLKAGRHVFPFQLQVGGSLPSSTYTDAFGGAGVMYKFRALAVRPGLSHNFQTVVPVTILRSFASEALEYQQTLEIENTWPGKIMYSIMIPHKAYAAGDTVTAVAKFSPISKGTTVLSVSSSITETTKISCRSTQSEASRVVATNEHCIIDGRAFELGPSGLSMQSSISSARPTSQHASSSSERSVTTFHPSSSRLRPESLPLPSTSTAPVHNTSDPEEETSADVVTQLSIRIPLNVTPTHPLEPIVTSHRIRWSVVIGNLDGHTSEVQCMLPLHVLDPSLLDEARSYTLATRRLLLSLEEEESEPQTEEGDADERELPSYDAHIRDRIANQYLSDATTIRVPNSWVQTGFSPTIHSTSDTSSDSSLHTTLPSQPNNEPSSSLDWINSELLMSLRNLDENREFYRANNGSPDSDTSPLSRSSSLTPSRRPSRCPSPEHNHVIPEPNLNETITHSSNASRSLQGIFSITMKPFTSLSGPSHWFSGRSGSSHTYSAPVSRPSEQRGSHSSHHHGREQQTRQRGTSQPQDTRPTHNGAELAQISLHLAFTEVPDYGIASRGFLGGVPPLSSLQGLPSYDETQKRKN